MDQGTASILVAVFAVAGAFVGVWVGGRISANAARDAAQIAAEAARQAPLTALEIAKVDREELRATRFADRVRELAAEMLDSGERYLTALGVVMIKSYAGHDTEVLEFDHTIGRAAQELRLLVRRPETYAEIEKLYEAITNWDMHKPIGSRPKKPDERQAEFELWEQTWAAYLRRAKAFEDAIRVELDRTPMERPLQELTIPAQPTE